MKTALTFFQHDGALVFKIGNLLRCEHFADGIHVVCQAGFFQETPVMTARNIMHAAVFLGGII